MPVQLDGKDMDGVAAHLGIEGARETVYDGTLNDALVDLSASALAREEQEVEALRARLSGDTPALAPVERARPPTPEEHAQSKVAEIFGDL